VRRRLRLSGLPAFCCLTRLLPTCGVLWPPALVGGPLTGSAIRRRTLLLTSSPAGPALGRRRIPPQGGLAPLGHHHFAADQHRAPCCAAPCPGRPCSAMSVGRRPSSGQPPSPPRQHLSMHAASPAATTFTTVASREVASRQPAPARWRRASRTCEVGVGVGLAGLLVHVLLSLCPYSSQANSINRCPLSHLPSMLFPCSSTK